MLRAIAHLNARIFSSLMLGELFGCAVLNAVVFGAMYGWRAAGIVVGIYFGIVMLSLFAGYLLKNVAR